MEGEEGASRSIGGEAGKARGGERGAEERGEVGGRVERWEGEGRTVREREVWEG